MGQSCLSKKQHNHKRVSSMAAHQHEDSYVHIQVELTEEIKKKISAFIEDEGYSNYEFYEMSAVTIDDIPTLSEAEDLDEKLTEFLEGLK